MSSNYPGVIGPHDVVETVAPPHALYRVIGVARTRATVEDEAGKRWKISLAGIRSTDREFVSTALAAPRLETGNVVTIKPEHFQARFGYAKDQRFVVTKEPRDGKISIVKLGGDNGRYLRTHDNHVDLVEDANDVWEAYESWREKGQAAMRALHVIWQALGDYDDRKHMTFGDDPQTVVDEFLASRRSEV